MPRINTLNGDFVSIQPPADISAGPNPISIMADANLHLETDADEITAVLSLSMNAAGKPVPAPASREIVLKKADRSTWHRIAVTSEFVCPAPEFLTVTAECALTWMSGNETLERKEYAVRSLIISANLEQDA